MQQISGRNIIIIDNLLTADECQEIIKERDVSLMHIERGAGVAIYDRGSFQSPVWAAKLQQRLRKYLPSSIDPQLNVSFRFSKYVDGGYFGIHRDAVSQDTKGRRSFMTVNIFLNEGFNGGETEFIDENGRVVVSAKPCPGRAAVFDQQILHRGNLVTGKIPKYLLRTDIMQ